MVPLNSPFKKGLAWSFLRFRNSFSIVVDITMKKKLPTSFLPGSFLVISLLGTFYESFYKLLQEASMTAHTCDPSSWKAEAGGLPWVQGQPKLNSKTLSKEPSNTKTTTFLCPWLDCTSVHTQWKPCVIFLRAISSRTRFESYFSQILTVQA